MEQDIIQFRAQLLEQMRTDAVNELRMDNMRKQEVIDYFRGRLPELSPTSRPTFRK